MHTCPGHRQFRSKKIVGMKMPKYKGILNIDQTLTVFNCLLAPEAKQVNGKTHSKDFDSLETCPFPLDNPDFSITFLASIIKSRPERSGCIVREN